jgi:amidase
MPIGANLPSVARVLEMADSFGIDMNVEDATIYRGFMQGLVNSSRRIDAMTEDKPEVKYPRTTGKRPAPEDNPHNAWYWRSEIKGSGKGVLKGLKVGIKDAVCVAGLPMMNGSRLFEGYVPDVDATIVTRILDAGGTILGKTNCEDMSFSGGSHTCALGPVRNPHKPTHSAGGSSGGSGAAIAAGDCELTTGGDQGGSIRIPASHNGIVGHKPTYGLVPYTGAMMIEMTMDHVGPMADNVENCARLLSAMAGPDPLDPRQRGVIPKNYVKDYTAAIGKGCKGIKIGVLEDGFGFPDPWGDTGLPGSATEVDKKVRAALQRLKKKGASLTKVSNPRHEDAFHLWSIIILEGAAAFMLKGNGVGTNWAGFYNSQLLDNVAKSAKSRINDISVSAKLVLLAGEYLQSDYHGRYHAKAQNIRGQITRSYDELLDKYDVLVTPTVPMVAPPIPDNDASLEDRMGPALNMIHNTACINLTGHPAISVPCGTSNGLPVGFHIIGKHFDDLTVLQVADAVEKCGNWKNM